MKKYLSMIVLVFGLLGLAACGPSGSSAGATPTTGDEGLLAADYENALPVQMQLALGTLKLEGTENEVDAETAGELLPLWKAARSLSGSDTTAPQELEAVYRQIEETMIPAQIQAIAAMKLTGQEMAQAAEELGLSLGPGSSGMGGELTAEMQATMQARRESGAGFAGGSPGGAQGGMPAGGLPPGDMPPGAGGRPADADSATTANSTGTGRAGRGGGTAIYDAVYDAVIDYLDGKVE